MQEHASKAHQLFIPILWLLLLMAVAFIDLQCFDYSGRPSPNIGGFRPAFAPGVVPEATWPPPVKPIRGQLLHLHAPARIATRILWGSSCYIVPWARFIYFFG